MLSDIFQISINEICERKDKFIMLFSQKKVWIKFFIRRMVLKNLKKMNMLKWESRPVLERYHLKISEGNMVCL